MTLTVAILGRPNVGKSTLFNRLVGRKIALVDDQPGVTRDRREGDARIGDLKFKIFDTAGLDEARRDTLEARMSAQAETAIGDADVVLFVIDARAGVTPTDKQFAERAKSACHCLPWLLRQIAYGPDSEPAEDIFRSLPDAGQFADRERCKEAGLPTPGNLDQPIGL